MLRPLLAILLCLAAPPAIAHPIWSSSSEALLQIDGYANSIVRAIPLKGIVALAADTHGAVWVATASDVRKVGPNGDPLFRSELSALGLAMRPILAVDPYDESIWFTDSQSIVHLDSSGARLFSTPAPFAAIRQVAIGLDQSVWLLGNKQLTRLSSIGVPIMRVDLHALADAEPKIVAVDDLGAIVWIAGERKLVQLDTGSASIVLRSIALPESVRGIALEPRTGTLWLLGNDALTAWTALGTVARSVDLAVEGLQDAASLAADPTGGNLWIAHRTGVSRVSASGEVTATIAVAKGADQVASAPFRISPQLALLQPADGTLTNDPTGPVRLALGAICNEQPCGFSGEYLRGYALTATLNGTSIGTLFSLDPASGNASYIAQSRLPEGTNVFSAQVRDAFGRASNRVESRFIVDTTPPSFAELTPPDGSALAVPQVTLRGKLDEPGQVFVENLAEFAGIGPNPADANFTFGLTMKPGTNVVRLKAIDLAGNAASSLHRLNLAQQAIALEILAPANGALVDGNTMVVAGRASGAANLGISVNGIVAATDGDLYYANVPVLAGGNLITVTATSPEAPSASRTVIVTGVASPFEVVASPASGIAPHPVSFRAFSRVAGDIARIAVDSGVAGVPAVATNDVDPIEIVYREPGVYAPKVTITGVDGAAHEFTRVIVVTSVSLIDAKLRAIYAGMLGRLRAGDVEGALKSFAPGGAETYRSVFEALRPNIASVVDQLGTIAGGSFIEGLAEYVLVQETAQGRQAFLMYLVQASDGTWLINSL